jgi:hypothetical protein
VNGSVAIATDSGESLVAFVRLTGWRLGVRGRARARPHARADALRHMLNTSVQSEAAAARTRRPSRALTKHNVLNDAA